MMTVYKVEMETLDFDWGRHTGWKLLGYYANKEKATRIAAEAYANRCPIDEGETRITEIEVDTEE